MDFVFNAIETTISSFDFAFCVIVNVSTFIVIKSINETKYKLKNSIWTKRIILLLNILIFSTIYYFSGVDTKLLINSAILAPISWSWIFKPLCKHFNIDYKKVDDVI